MKELLNKIHCGDCLEFMKQIPDKSVDIIITDPPYGMKYFSNHYKQGNPHKKILGDEQFPFWIVDVLLRKARRAVFLFCRWDNLLDLQNKPKSFIVWAKNNWTAGDLSYEFGRSYEGILFYPLPEFSFKYRHPDLIQCKRVSPSQLLHPTQKPVELITKILETCSSENDIIFDPFAGSGTTCVAAKQLGRQFIGIELDPDYCEIAEKRLSQEVLSFEPKKKPMKQEALFEP